METLNNFEAICRIGKHLHDYIYTDLAIYFAGQDRQKEQANLRLLKNVLGRIYPIRKVMRRSAINFDYELRVLDWIERYVAKLAFLPLSFHRMLSRWEIGFARNLKARNPKGINK